MFEKKEKNYDNWLYIIKMRKRNYKKNTTFLERMRIKQNEIVDGHRNKKRMKEIQYREWLENPTRRGKPIVLLTYEELRKMRNRFLKITYVCWFIGVAYMFIFWNGMVAGDEMAKVYNAFWLAVMLIGFAHVFLAGGIDYAIYKRWKDNKSFLFSVLEEGPQQ